MTSEATLNQINNLEYRQVTVSDASAFSKGTFMVFTATPNTVNHYTNQQNFHPAGVLAVEKVANDGQTTVPVIVRGTVTLPVGDGNVAFGDPLLLASVDNAVRTFGAASIEKVGDIIGVAESSANAGATVTVRLRLA